jgi:RimJ/RimL family protein N-acetyltransferase
MAHEMTIPEGMYLQAATQEDFDWLIGIGKAERLLSVAPDLAPAEVLDIVRQLPASWLMVVSNEVVGIISLKSETSEFVEIGYGVAASRQGLGFASAAVAALLPILSDRGVSMATAETSIDNPASQKVLEKSGFIRASERLDDEDGPMIGWQRTL